MASAHALEWQASMERELASRSKHDVYELVPSPKGRKIIGSMWVFKVKPDGVSSLHSVHKVFVRQPGQTLDVNTLHSVASQVSALCWPSLPATTGM